MTEQMSRIAAQIETLAQQYSESYTWGVRWDVAGLPVGHIFPPSRRWEDNQVTGDVLPGTSCTEVDGLKYITEFNYYEGTPYIVCGIHAGYGEDCGEVLLSEC